MKKLMLSLVIVAILAVALGTSGVALAQGPVNPTNPNSGYGSGYGRMGSGFRGGMAGQGVASSQSGLLHDEMVATFAEKFGLTVEELKTRLANGETVSQIAFAQGLSFEEFRTWMAEARTQALDQAVASGTITQAQADWMKERGAGMRGGYVQGAGLGRFANPNCPYAAQTATP